MRLPMNRLLPLFMFLAACTKSPLSKSGLSEDSGAPATPDLTVAFEGAPQISGGRIHFSLRIANIGAPMAQAGEVRSKAFLIKKDNYAAKLAGQGIVLESIVSNFQLAAEQSTVVEVDQLLPNIPQGSYYLGATTNTLASSYRDADSEDTSAPAAPTDPVKESYKAQLNNVTENLADLGEISNVSAVARTGKYDLYHEVENATIRLQSGNASHSSRNILRNMEGEDAIPDESEWDSDISARFVFIDLEKGKMFLGAYTSGNVDKVWTAISFNHEHDLQGRDIHVDYYSNSPNVSALAPGAYVLGVLMNVSDAFKLDSYPENNLDLTYMNLTSQSLLKQPEELWVSATEASAVLGASLADRSDQNVWTFEAPEKPEWITLTPSTSGGGFIRPFEAAPFRPRGGNYRFNLRVSADASLAPVGLTEFKVKITATRGDVVVSGVTSVKFFKNSGPVLQFVGLPANIGDTGVTSLGNLGGSIEDISGTKVMHFKVGVKSAGTDHLFYSATSENLQIEANAHGDLAPSESSMISFKIPLLGFRIPANSAKPRISVYFTVQSNAGEQGQSFDICFDPAATQVLPIDCSEDSNGDNGDDGDRE